MMEEKFFLIHLLPYDPIESTYCRERGAVGKAPPTGFAMLFIMVCSIPLGYVTCSR
jgi:hypothetical protein